MPRRTNTFAHDVDHEMAQLLAIAMDLAFIDTPYPLHVVSALQTAYCVHFRAFMEFAHNGRPPRPPKPKSKAPRDIRLDDLARQPTPLSWTSAEIRRFRAADKLAAHLTRGRAQRRPHETRMGRCGGSRPCPEARPRYVPGSCRRSRPVSCDGPTAQLLSLGSGLTRTWHSRGRGASRPAGLR
jgi:hypothetical protein